MRNQIRPIEPPRGDRSLGVDFVFECRWMLVEMIACLASKGGFFSLGRCAADLPTHILEARRQDRFGLRTCPTQQRDHTRAGTSSMTPSQHGRTRSQHQPPRCRARPHPPPTHQMRTPARAPPRHLQDHGKISDTDPSYHKCGETQIPATICEPCSER